MADLPAGRQARQNKKLMKYYIYVLQLNDNTFYKGLTNNLQKRISEHKNGKCLSTKNKRPIILIYSEKFDTRIEARNREKFFKSGEGRELIKNILIDRCKNIANNKLIQKNEF